MRTKTLAITLLVPVLLLAACGRLNDDDGAGGSGGTGGSNGIDHPTGGDELVLRVQIGGGFVPVEWNLRSVPGISIFGDGRMIVEGPMIEIYPSPALPNLQVSRLTEEAIQAILEEAERAGLLGPDASYDYPCIADAPTTTFTVVADGTTHTVSAYALGFEDGSGQASCADVKVDARAELRDFSQKLGDLRSWLPEGSIGAEEEYVPTEMRVYVRPYQGDAELEQAQVEWPLADPLAGFGERDPNLADTRCGVVSGADLDALLPLAQTANELTPWSSGGTDHGLIFRPLLPDEHTC
jgi:hypothetical protein